MVRNFVLVFLTAWSIPTLAQTASPGLSPEWEIKQMLTTFIAGFERFKPLLEQATPREWKSVSSTEPFLKQLKNAQEELKYLGYNVESLIHQPDTLPLALESFLRMQSLESTVLSLGDGIRKHQSPELADRLESVLAANSDNKEKLRRYLIELAAAREAEFRLVDQEAQKCRSFLAAPPRKDGRR